MRIRRVLGAMAVVGLTFFASLSTANAASGPTITNPDITYLKTNQQFTVKGTATPGAVVVLHYHKQGTAAYDYSIERSLRASSNGTWSRSSVLDKDYRVFATVGMGNPHSKTVLFTTAKPPPPPQSPTTLGGIQNVYADLSGTTLGVQFVAINGYASVGFPPDPGKRFVSVKACVRNRGPEIFDDAAGNDFTLGTSDASSYTNSAYGTSEGPYLDLSHVAVQELRCGYLAFEVPTGSDVTQLRFTPDSSFASHTIRWTTP